jgi:hypothetical protein
MTANAATNKGIFLGQGISPFPTMYAFATNENASNKRFLPTLEGVKEISASELNEEMQAETQAKENFFSALPHISLD